MTHSPGGGGLVRLAAWIEQNGPTTAKEAAPPLSIVAGLVGGVQFPKLYDQTIELESWSWPLVKVWVTSYSFWFVAVVFLFTVFTSVWQFRHTRSQRQERTRLEGLLRAAKDEAVSRRAALQDAEQHITFLTAELASALKDLSESYLRRIMKDINLDRDSVRISLYGHDQETQSFVLAGRYSMHPVHTNPNRQRLPDNQGFLSQAWTNGGTCFVELDDFLGDDDYKAKMQEKCTMDGNHIDALRMKSRLYFGKAVSNDRRRTGIVMIESTQAGAFDERQMVESLEGKDEVLNDLIRRNSQASPFMTYQPQRQQ
ncbi:hypothetical protein [Achromobacter insolitus]|uniref:hypothetical protein n=1 Tax=Achromobacter insolitus TaxID=217204 RepID=UPI0027E0BF00|nr:hypothetical protein [Achromobacter insolitus]MDQ6213304.1 hypothetical protein [Achromobacter insolitus]